MIEEFIVSELIIIGNVSTFFQKQSACVCLS